MDERQNELPMDELEPQAAPEVPEFSEQYTAPVEEVDCIPENRTEPVEEEAFTSVVYAAPVEEEYYGPESCTAPVVAADSNPEVFTAPIEEDSYGPKDVTAPVPEDSYGPEGYGIPAAVASQEAPAPEAPAKPKKKLNKKLIIGGIAAVAVIALVIVLISLLGGKPKNYGVYVKDGEITMFVQGMDEPVELSSRLWKDADNRYLNSYTYSLRNLVAVRDNGSLVIYPDKYHPGEGATLYMCNPNKPKDDPEKIDSGITFMNLTEDGKTLLYLKGAKGTLHLYNVAKEEELIKLKNVVTYVVNDDMSKLCYKTDDGDIYLWTAETEEVKVAKDASAFRYFPDTDMLFVLTQDGELLRKTAELEEAEQIAEDVSRITAAYSTGEVYFVRDSEVEYTLLDYLDDDMATDDAAMTQPKKPSYPSAPKKPYYWNYDVYADYEADLAEYNELYAKYQEEYNKLKAEYDEAVDAYNAKQMRDEIRGYLDRTVTYYEYALSYFNGTEEVLLSDCVTSQNVESSATDVAVVVYSAYVPRTVEKPKMSEFTSEDYWSAADKVYNSLLSAHQGETQLCVALGAESTVVEHKDASHVTVSGDGTAVFFLDAPFAAFEGGKYTASSGNAPAAEAPAADYPAAEAPAEDGEEAAEEELIPAGQREYASLYKITIADGVVGQAEVFDSEVSYVFTYTVGKTAEDIFYYKAVDGDDKTGELYRNGLLLAEDVRQSSYRVDGDLLLFYTDWDGADRCGTLCALNLAKENAEVMEIGDDVTDFLVTETGDILFLQDYDYQDYEGTLMLFNMKKGESVEVDDDVICLLAAQ